MQDSWDGNIGYAGSTHCCLEAFSKSLPMLLGTCCVDLRTYAIAPRSAKARRIGTESHSPVGSVPPFSRCKVWDATGHPDSFINFSAGENLGYIVENSVFSLRFTKKC